MTSRGNWRSRGNPSNREGPNTFTKGNQLKTPCQHFQRGRCFYGERCKFSHDAKKAPGFKSAPAASPPTAHDLDSRNQYFNWRGLLRSGILSSGYSRREHEEILQFWNRALEILESDSRENHQFLVKDLVDDKFSGYNFILATTDTGNSEGVRLGLSYDEPFLKVITHPSLLDCLSVDSYVGTLYTFFGGNNGDRAIRYLRRVYRSLTSIGEYTNEDSPVVSLDMVELLSKTLYQLLSRVRRARFHDELPALLDLILEAGSQLTETCSKADIDGIESRIEVMHSLITSADRSLVAPRVHEEAPQSVFVLSSFPLDMQTPGGRHDNDLADISEVKILPTHGEIASDSSEYLPATNFLQPHILPDPLQRYIDSTFRLLRHDVFGSAKDFLRVLLQQDDLTRLPSFSSKDSGAHLYLGARVSQIFINEKKNELEATLSFTAPPQVRKRTSTEQCRWWQDSNRLEEGSLVCFLVSRETDKKLIFLEVTVKNASKDRAHRNRSSLVSDTSQPGITVKLAAPQDLTLLCQLYSQRTTGILVDFRGLIPATFVPILKNLQRIQRQGDMALKKWILPSRKGEEDGHSIPPPTYARKQGFIIPLASITIAGAERVTLDPSTPESIDLLKLQTQTGLDHGQCLGLIAALTREYALIQGPPGTGKSYLGVKLVQVLLEIKQNTKIGPVLVICYTNHALDQFLKHLLDVGIQKVIRIGGRSQATELEGKNLRVVSRDIGKTMVESQTLGKSYGSLEECMSSAGYSMKPLHQSQKSLSWDVMQHFLRRRWPRIHEQLEQADMDGFKSVTDDKLLSWLGVKWMNAQNDQKQNESEVDDVRLEGLTRAATENIHSLSIPDRRILAMSWFKQWQENEAASLFEALDHAASLREDINAVHEEVNRRALIQADVVGITTTALARHIETLRRLGTKVIICEEAAEVMEAHVISALMPGVEHFIQIGDHRQLRPQIQNHSLSLESPTGKTWQLDRSQFERRAVGEPGLKPAPVAQLNVQRRMRPEISQLIRRVYPKLEDHESVLGLPNVVGMRNNLFWLDHQCDEDSRDDGSRVKSHSNQWEVDMATALVRHLVRQGEYKSTDIALLTPYTGQLRKLRTSLNSDFEICLSERDLETLAADGIDNIEDEDPESNGRKALEKKTLLQTLRLATVDNFQGEEAKVIVVSLVRSNAKRKVGFLRTENRINVLLSRAQHGMYLIGNSETYLNVPMWADVHTQLAYANAVGTELALCCPRHPETPILCSEPRDFERKSPEGGCSLPCTRRLEPCGHQCQATCHSAIMHDGFACGKPCPRIRSTCEHKCPKLCGDDCGPCLAKIQDVELPCGHIQKAIFCYQMQNLKVIKCDVQVEKTVARCGHTIQVSCFKDVTSPIFRCPEPCTEILSCGHDCGDRCSNCLDDVHDGRKVFSHRKCTKRCDRPYGVCNHRCHKPCHNGESCGNCEVKCEVNPPPIHHLVIIESVLTVGTGEMFTLGVRLDLRQGMCTMHREMHLVLRAPRILFNAMRGNRCTKILKCGHQCPSICGEDCPNNLCRECGDKGDARVDLLEMKTYSEINLNETPIILLGCGHFFTAESVDGIVGLEEVYTRDKNGKFDGLRDVSSSLASVVPSCPDCKQPIRQFVTKRYNRVINRAVMDETCKRFLTKGRRDLEALESRLNDIEDETNSKQALVAARDNELQPSQLKAQFTACKRLVADALALSKDTGVENQPMKRLMDAIAICENSPRDEVASLSARMKAMKIVQESDNLITLSAQLIRIKTTEVMLRDVFRAMDKNKTSASLPLKILPNSAAALIRLLRDCRNLITQANERNFSRIVITATISFAKIAQLDAWYHRSHPGDTRNHLLEAPGVQKLEDRYQTTRDLLATALKLCGELNNPELQERVEEMARLFETRYETVTPEELKSIKTAMVSGRGGIATHAGHWYNCVNGHPFAIGECGMPMEQARCPECGSPIGGRNHAAVEGVSRAEQME
ncbi:uncharacterized protein N7459_007655 [Penicillium hispanicum]|uniref:uncharacterized protein n=1 Tax=Penicillium hispanicum TaxID=1080232 RepID=UPI0025423DBA|nr:uncharacterized protein N7459_007655 [Penicillium hispanicum]KAJ5578691.1 hypothetical protein N7459_007655 [Penicillium hispanicum]